MGSFKRHFVNGFTDLYYFIISLFKLQRFDAVFSSQLLNRRFKVNGKYFDYYVDPLVKEMKSQNRRVGFIDLNPADASYGSKTPAYSAAMHFNFLRKLAFLISRLTAPFLAGVIFKNPWLAPLEKISQTNPFDVKKAQQQLAVTILFEYTYSLFYRLFLGIMRPQEVLMVCFYAKWGEIYACHKMGVKSIDVQHGAQGVAHPAYSFYKKQYNTIVNEFWNWSEYDNACIKGWGGKAKMIGVPFDQFLKKNPAAIKSFIADLDSEIQHKNRPCVLISLQHGYDQSFVAKLVEDQNYFFLIRMHPLMKKYEVDSVVESLTDAGFKN